MSVSSLPAANSQALPVWVLEEDADLRQLLAITLGRAGYCVDVFAHSKGFAARILQSGPALMLLGDTSTGPDSLAILLELESHPRGRKIRKIVLSSNLGESRRILALESGADDLLSKPFSMRELLARVAAVLRPLRHEDGLRVLRVGNLVADLQAMELSVDGKLIGCTNIEFQLMVYLMRRPSRVHSRSQLIAEIWPDEKSDAAQRVVDVYIRRLRMKIEEKPSEPAYIVTRRGHGYLLNNQH